MLAINLLGQPQQSRDAADFRTQYEKRPEGATLPLQARLVQFPCNCNHGYFLNR